MFSLCSLLCGCDKDKKEEVWQIQNMVELNLKEDFESHNNVDFLSGKTLGFKSVSYRDQNGYILSFLEDENMKIDMEKGILQSIEYGKHYIDINSCIIEFDSELLSRKSEDVLMKLYNEKTGNLADIMSINHNNEVYYAISGNSNCIYVDCIVPFSQDSQYNVYYHILIEDINKIIDISDSTFERLNDSVKDLQTILGIVEELVLPVS